MDYENKKCNVPYLVFDKDNVVLKRNDKIYTQIQTQLYVMGINRCNLLIYTPFENGSIILTIHRDEEIIRSSILLSESFYFKSYLPALVNYLKQKSEKNVQDITKLTGLDISNIYKPKMSNEKKPKESDK